VKRKRSVPKSLMDATDVSNVRDMTFLRHGDRQFSAIKAIRSFHLTQSQFKNWNRALRKGGHFVERVASVPPGIGWLIIKKYPELMENPQLFHEWLGQNKAYSLLPQHA
jgi:hypothetical protein